MTVLKNTFFYGVGHNVKSLCVVMCCVHVFHNPGAETHSSPIGVGGRKAPIPLVSKLFSNMRKI